MHFTRAYCDKSAISEGIVKTCNISFVLEGINRWQSTMICELKDSYVQQSQRYVTMDADGYTLPDLKEEDAQKARELVGRAFALYEEMSQIKEEFKGRPKKEHYLHGIPVEDARYILPLAVKTNLSVAPLVINWLDWFKMRPGPLEVQMFADVHAALLQVLPETLGQWLDKQDYEYEETGMLNQYYQDELDEIMPQRPGWYYCSTFHQPELKAGLGALTSTKAEPPSQVLESWGEEAAQKAKGVTRRVMGYGHTSIAEQCRTTFGMMFSLVTYHQQVRHRLPSTFREPWLNILLEPERPPVVAAVCDRRRL